MAKTVKKLTPLVLDRTMLLALLLAATGYIIRASWPAMFFWAAAFMLGAIWSFRVITTSPSRQLRLLATLMLVLLGALLALTLGSAKGLV